MFLSRSQEGGGGGGAMTKEGITIYLNILSPDVLYPCSIITEESFNKRRCSLCVTHYIYVRNMVNTSPECKYHLHFFL